MKQSSFRILLSAAGLLVAVSSAHAASATWDGTGTPVNALWTNGVNWDTGSAPGGNATGNTDVATFNAAAGAGGSTITVDANRNLQRIDFGAAPGSYTFSGGSFLFTAAASSVIGSVNLSSSVTAATTQTFDSDIKFAGGTTNSFNNQSLNSKFVINSDISGTVAANTTVGFNRNVETPAITASAAVNEINGDISNGTATTLNVSFGGSVGAIWKVTGTNTYTGTTFIAGTATAIFEGTTSSAGAITLGSSGQMQLSNAANNGGIGTGTITVSGGTLRALDAATVLSNKMVNGNGNLTVRGTNAIELGGSYTQGHNSAKFIGIQDGVTLTLNDIYLTNAASAAAGTFAFGGGTAINGNFIVKGTIANFEAAGAANAGLTVNVASNRSVTFSGTNTYTGATTVTSGTLLINGSTTSSSAVDVASAATLGGSGTAAGVVTVVSGGFLAPGQIGVGASAVGTLATGNVNLNGSSTFALQYNTTLNVADRLNSGAINLAAGNTVVLTLTDIGADVVVGDVYTLATYTSWNGNLFSYLGSALLDDSVINIGSNSFIFSYNGVNGLTNAFTLQSTSVPEPSTMALFLGSIGVMTALRRRRSVA